jgi:hypothetical protein
VQNLRQGLGIMGWFWYNPNIFRDPRWGRSREIW